MSIRGETKRKTRAARLRLLNEQHTYEEMANRIGGKASPAYLSQIGNEHLGKGRKTPRGLSDNYASRIEQAFNLPDGWFDLPVDQDAAADAVNEPSARYRHISIKKSVPLISWVAAGNWGEIVDEFAPGEAEEWIATTANVGRHAFALRITGDSMEPLIADGAVVVVDPDTDAKHRSIVIVRQNADSEATCKRLIFEGTRAYLRPENPRYPILEMGKDAVIVGVVRQVVVDLE